MPLHLVTPFDRTDPSEDEQPVSQPVQTLRSRMADGCYILLRGCLFLGSSYLMALGLPLLFFLLLSGGNPDAFFAHVANLGDRFLAADLARRVTFLGQCKFVLIGLATLVVVWRMPRFIRDLDRELSGEKL
ncbi:MULTISPECIES: hypothetical protein [Sphingomonadales]|uniref:Conjugative transfer protein n=1 Tax=Rhizorhabdus wittichii TaxID=160791 RepID=A0A975D535_9SPHN|nr:MULTISPECIES: hypothetical protein [Sphingomonadales]PLK23526.1 hypothetical protein C0V72_09010 [Porphyrobacter sp. TH134]QTH23061.1 hypothetical protein HRJ34_05995 [Rhizorhabdus wittichii]